MTDARIKGIGYALLAALLFGASTPLAKLFLGETSPFLVAGLLYLGSGVGLGLWILISKTLVSSHTSQPSLTGKDWPWFLTAAFFGGLIAPVLLMGGLKQTAASTTALLLNLEAVATSLIAWFIFKENVNRQVAIGFILITIGASVLSFSRTDLFVFSWGSLLIMAACICWGIDNNLTRKVSAADPFQIACLKGLMAGTINSSLALAMGSSWPSAKVLIGVGFVGFLGYGLSLVCFILGLRHLGTARTGAYFSTAPFAGAVLALTMWPETFSWSILLAGLLMAAGVWMHFTEVHDHEHMHEPIEHEHLHIHDEHHQHSHSLNDPAGDPHSHRHQHKRLVHSHPHDPDIHHRHSH